MTILSDVLRLNLTGTPDEIVKSMIDDEEAVHIDCDLTSARLLVEQTKREIALYQAKVLYALTRQFDYKGARILEIGTATGYSAAVIAQAVPSAYIVTLNPKRSEFVVAVDNLHSLSNVHVKCIKSEDYLVQWQHIGHQLDMVFVDGNHDTVARDLWWFNQLKQGGLLLFHDYSPADSGRPTPPVYNVCNEMRDSLGREFDVSVIDNRRVGMVGFYRQPDEMFTGIHGRGEGYTIVGGEWQNVG